MHIDDRHNEDVRQLFGTRGPAPRMGPWVFYPAADPRLDRCVKHHDEVLSVVQDRVIHAEYLVRRHCPAADEQPPETITFVKGVIFCDGRVPLVLRSWHRALRLSR